MSWRIKSVWTHNGPCDVCGSRDNRAHYSDGHTYCFGCRDYTHPTSLPWEEAKVAPLKITKTFTPGPMPEENLAYLRQFISDDEIDEFFFYDMETKRHVFQYLPGEPDHFFEARSVNLFPKTLSFGMKPTVLLGKWRETGVVVVVEDLLSAIKISRNFGALPLFGCFMSADQMAALSRRVEVRRIVFWLDSNKFDVAQTLSQRMSNLLPSTCIFTEKDPKYYTDAEINEEVSEAVSACNATLTGVCV